MDMVDLVILPILQHVDYHISVQNHKYLHPKDMVDFVILPIVENVDDQI
jgi:hypothetical protein